MESGDTQCEMAEYKMLLRRFAERLWCDGVGERDWVKKQLLEGDCCCEKSLAAQVSGAWM
jgi:hypothetical protein